MTNNTHEDEYIDAGDGGEAAMSTKEGVWTLSLSATASSTWTI